MKTKWRYHEDDGLLELVRAGRKVCREGDVEFHKFQVLGVYGGPGWVEIGNKVWIPVGEVCNTPEEAIEKARARVWHDLQDACQKAAQVAQTVMNDIEHADNVWRGMR